MDVKHNINTYGPNGQHFELWTLILYFAATAVQAFLRLERAKISAMYQKATASTLS